MFKLKKCQKCKIYTLQEKCRICGKNTESAHYKYLKFENKVQDKKEQII